MYNGQEYLSCIKVPAAKQVMAKNADGPEKAERMDLAADHRDLISAANKVFGEGKWSHTVVSQTLDFVKMTGVADKPNVKTDKWCAGCVSFVKVQLESGNFHEDVGYYSVEESTQGSSIHNARIGSAVNALKRVLLSFGGKIERELRQLQRQISPEQANAQKDAQEDAQKDVAQSLVKQILEKSNISVNSMQLENQHLSNRLKLCYAPQTKCISEPEPNKNSNLLTTGPTLVSTVNNSTTEANSSSVKIQSAKIIEPSPNKTNSTNDQNPALSTREILRMERKRKQMEKQMEFKRRMLEKEELSNSDNKPNARY